MFSYLLAIALVAAVSADPIRARQPFPHGRIVGGEDAEIETFPYQVSLRLGGRHMCGGAIISKNYIVTAGHCIYPYGLSIRVGSTYHSHSGSIHYVEEVIRHENFTTDENGIPTNDIAVIKVKTPFVFSDKVQPINLYESGEESFPGLKAVVTGWGTTSSGGSASSHLQTVSIPIIDKQLCNDAYESWGGIPECQICAAYFGVGGKDTCQGDSGGPLAIDGRLAGIVSWGNGCAKPYYPGAYTEVASYRKWIEQNTDLA